MADDRGSSSAGVLLAFLSGAALGAVAALLLAPQRDASRANSCVAMPVVQKAICVIWQAAQAKRSKRSWRKGRNLWTRRRRSCAKHLTPVARRCNASVIGCVEKDRG